MKDKEKTKDHLLKELKELRHRIAELDTLQEKRKQAEDTLRESEDKYRTIFETTGTATFIIEEDTTISLANKEFFKLSGYTQKEVEGKKSWTDFVAHKEDLEKMKVYHNARRIDPGAAPRNYEFKFIDKKGAVRDIFTTIEAIPGTKKSVGSFLDITERKQAENDLLESERKLSTLMGNLPGISYRCLNDKNWTMEFISKGCFDLTGYKSFDLIGNRTISYNALIHPGDRGSVWANIQEAMAARRSFLLEYRIQTATGEQKWVWEQGVGVFSKAGDLLGLEGLIIDITDRKRVEEALQESERYFRYVVENSLTGVTVIQDDQVVYRNPEQKRLAGPLSESFAHLTFESIHSDDVEKVRQNYQKLVSGEKARLDMDFRFYPLGKKASLPDLRWVYCRAGLVEYRGKEVVLFNMMDMTKAKKLEYLLRIQDKMSSLGRVAAGIAHEIRNPLSGINIYLSTLQKIFDRADSLDKVKMILEQLQSASGKIESVIRRVMDFSKPGEPKLVPANINQPIEEAIQLSSVTLRKSEISLEKDLSEDLPQCNADPHLIEEVILNLITNAAEAMKGMEGGERIEITSSMGNKHILVKVSDSGPGVPSNLKEKIFDPFYTTKDGSTGIGLSLSHRVISDHGGSLSVGPSKWGGAEFIIKIPIKESST